MDTELSILVISYYFPPDAAVGAKRVSRFCEYLPEFGIRPTVLTIDEESSESLDPSLRSLKSLQIERARPHTTFLDRYHRWAQTRAVDAKVRSNRPAPDEAPYRRTRSIRQHVLALLQFPDLKRGWYFPAVRAASQILKNNHVDAVFSSGPPWTAHAVGYSVSRRHNLPWIADFRDQWASDPWRRYANDSKGSVAWRDRLDLWVEDRWTRRADLVICVTIPQRDALLRAHPKLVAHKVITIPNGFDRAPSSLTGGATRAKGGPRKFLHIGNLYGGRRINVFCKVVASLVCGGRLAPDSVRILLIGDVDRDIARDARESAPALFENGMIAFLPRVDWQRAQQYLHDADVLLLFQGDHATAIPAKFFEYLHTGKPILAVVGPGALSDIIRDTDSGVVVAPHNEVGIASAIEHLLEAKPRGSEEVERVAKRFEFRTLTAELAENLRRICSPGVDRGNRP